MRKSDARRAVAALYATLGRIGLIVGSSGNVSIRTKGGMIVTPSGGSPDTVRPRDMAEVSFDGVARGDATPSSEWPMHAAVYRSAPEAGCIVHTHADACTALACLNEPLPAFHYMVVQFGGTTVPCAPYVTVGTPDLAVLAGETIRGHSACLLANHGMIVHGRDAQQALDRAILLESLCRQYLMARAAGTPRLLTDAEMDAAKVRFLTYGPRPRPGNPGAGNPGADSPDVGRPDVGGSRVGGSRVGGPSADAVPVGAAPAGPALANAARADAGPAGTVRAGRASAGTADAGGAAPDRS